MTSLERTFVGVASLQVSVMVQQPPLVVTVRVDLVLVLVTVLALWTRLSWLGRPAAVV